MNSPIVGASARPASGLMSRVKRRKSREQAIEARPQQVRALGEQAAARVGELERAVVVGHRHPHHGGLGRDPELGQQALEVRVVAVVEDDEAGVDPALAAGVRDGDRVRVAAQACVRLVDRDLVAAREQACRGKAGDAAADDGDPLSFRCFTHGFRRFGRLTTYGGKAVLAHCFRTDLRPKATSREEEMGTPEGQLTEFLGLIASFDGGAAGDLVRGRQISELFAAHGVVVARARASVWPPTASTATSLRPN